MACAEICCCTRSSRILGAHRVQRRHSLSLGFHLGRELLVVILFDRFVVHLRRRAELVIQIPADKKLAAQLAINCGGRQACLALPCLEGLLAAELLFKLRAGGSYVCRGRLGELCGRSFVGDDPLVNQFVQALLLRLCLAFDQLLELAELAHIAQQQDVVFNVRDDTVHDFLRRSASRRRGQRKNQREGQQTRHALEQTPHQKIDPRLKKNWKCGIRDSVGTVAQPPRPRACMNRIPLG